MFYIIGIGHNVDIYPSKWLQKLLVMKIGLSFSMPILYLKINISLTFFAYSWAKLNVVYVLKKTDQKVNICL